MGGMWQRERGVAYTDRFSRLIPVVPQCLKTGSGGEPQAVTLGIHSAVSDGDGSSAWFLARRFVRRAGTHHLAWTLVRNALHEQRLRGLALLPERLPVAALNHVEELASCGDSQPEIPASLPTGVEKRVPVEGVGAIFKG